MSESQPLANLQEPESLIDEAEDTTAQDTAQEATGAPASASIMEDPAVIAMIDKRIQEGIQAALKGKTPRANVTDPTAAERAAFHKMGYKERLHLFNSNPALYKKLDNGGIQ